MRPKCVLIYLVLSALAFFLFSARKPIAAEYAADTPGCLTALGKTGKPMGPCPLVHTAVQVEISGVLARVTVRQEFRNLFREPIEAVYAFPLPHSAAVDDMTIHVGSRTIRGVIRRREDARAIYEQARANGQLAALLDQERPNIFTQQLANILPGQNVDVVIHYTETLKYAAGGYSFVFPMVVGPRYIPGRPIGKQGGGWAPDTTRVPDASLVTPPVTPPGTRSGHDISIEVSIDSGVPFSNLRSAQHEVAVLRSDTHSALVRLADRASIPNKDFVLSYDVAGLQLQDGLVTHRTGGDGYFMLILQPPRLITPEQVVPRELVFVLDTSGSMQGFPIEKAKEAMKLALDGLYSHDTFNLITFSGDTRILFPYPVSAVRENIALAWRMLDSSHGSGGTEMMRAIRAALAPSDDQGHVRIVCFMTDGLVGNDMDIIAEVQKHPNARVFAFGIGSSPNRFLLDKIAEEGRGAVEYVTLEEDGSAAAARFHERVRNPLLTDITLEWGGTPVTDLLPRRIPDLFSAEPGVICGRYGRGGTATVRLRGRAGSDMFVRDIRIPLPESAPHHEALARLWARERVDALMAEDFSGIQRGNPRPDVREAITRLGLDYNLMTQFTSFVAVEDRIVTDGGKPRTVQVPVEMPEGLRYEGIFGVPSQYMSPASIPHAGSGVTGGVVGGVAGGVVGGVANGILGGMAPPAPPVPVAKKVAPVRVGGNVSEARLIRRVDPVYPETARRARVEGVVLLEVNIDERGDVTNVRVIQGHLLLCQPAVEAVKQWKYSPTVLNGTPVPVVSTVMLPFRLGGPSGRTPAEDRVDPAVARVIARVRAGQNAGSEPFIREGKVELELLILNRSEDALAKLRSAGFELISWPEGSTTAIGRIEPGKLEILLSFEAIRHIAPHSRRP